jgi:hypothetical protein
MKTKLISIAGIILLYFIGSSCADDFIIRGNGIPDSEARLVSGFSSVASEGNFTVHITSGAQHKIIIEAESNLMQYIETEVNGSRLRIHTRGLTSLRNRLPIEIYVTTPALSGIVQSGSGSITTGYFEADAFNCVVSGSGSIETSVAANVVEAVISGSGRLQISGSASSGNLIVSGSGQLVAEDLQLRDCEAKISGSGDIWTTVSQNLKAVITGSGYVFYSGKPQIEIVVSGSGGIIQKK